MTEERIVEGGTEKDNSLLDAFLKGERLSTEEFIVLTLQQQFAKMAREQNEVEDFDDDGCIGDYSEEKSAARLRRQRDSYDIEGHRGFTEAMRGFNTAALDRDEPIWAGIVAPGPARCLKPA